MLKCPTKSQKLIWGLGAASSLWYPRSADVEGIYNSYKRFVAQGMFGLARTSLRRSMPLDMRQLRPKAIRDMNLYGTTQTTGTLWKETYKTLVPGVMMKTGSVYQNLRILNILCSGPRSKCSGPRSAEVRGGDSTI